MSQAITWAVGQTLLDDYVIERELGRGGMGCVWLVKSRSTGRHFAVKQTLIKDDQHRKAFLSELQTWIDSSGREAGQRAMTAAGIPLITDFGLVRARSAIRRSWLLPGSASKF